MIGLGSDNNHQRECFIRWNNSPWNICWLQVGMRHPQELKRRFFMNLLKLTCLPTSLNFDSKSLNLLWCSIIHNTSRIDMLLLSAHLHLNTLHILCHDIGQMCMTAMFTPHWTFTLLCTMHVLPDHLRWIPKASSRLRSTVWTITPTTHILRGDSTQKLCWNLIYE